MYNESPFKTSFGFLFLFLMFLGCKLSISSWELITELNNLINSTDHIAILNSRLISHLWRFKPIWYWVSMRIWKFKYVCYTLYALNVRFQYIIIVLYLLRVLLMKGIKRSVILHLNVSEKIYGPPRTNLDKMHGFSIRIQSIFCL